MEVTLETLVIKHVDQSPTLVPSLNVTTTMENEVNIQQVRNHLGKTKTKIIPLEDQDLESMRERVQLKHEYEAPLVEKETLSTLAKDLQDDKYALISQVENLEFEKEAHTYQV